MNRTLHLMACLAVTCLAVPHIHAQSVTYEHFEDTYNQIASMETGQKWKFTPKYDYYSNVK